MVEEAEYTIKVWSGENAGTLIAEKIISNPIINEWNIASFQSPIELDVNEALWVGYHVSCIEGYPVGCDNGPAINGFGNMIYYDDEWKTLLELNPDMNYNWNIACHLYSLPYDEELYFKIYRETNNDGFEFYDLSYRPQCRDEEITLSDYYCYYTSRVQIKDGDTCESAKTNIACEYLMLGAQDKAQPDLIEIFPIPASKDLTIRSNEKIKNIKFYNMLGECVLKMEIGSNEGKVVVSGLKSGIYFVEVFGEAQKYQDKIMIIK
jgi:hypothetical protein